MLVFTHKLDTIHVSDSAALNWANGQDWSKFNQEDVTKLGRVNRFVGTTKEVHVYFDYTLELYFFAPKSEPVYFHAAAGTVEATAVNNLKEMADKARHCVVLSSSFGNSITEPERDNIVDLVTNIWHYCDELNIDKEAMMDSVRNHYEIEINGG